MSLQQIFTEKPEILQDPNDVEVVFGASAIFKCNAQGDPSPEIKWMLNSNDIDSNDARVRVSVDGTLQIDRIDTRDQGVYEVGSHFNGKINISTEMPLYHFLKKSFIRTDLMDNVGSQR
jgi:hypothetical protein